MKICYNLGADDYLAYLLYIATQSESVKKKRFRVQIIFSVLYLFTGVYFLISNEGSDYSTFIVFLALAVLWFVSYPKLEYLYRKSNIKRLQKKAIQMGKRSR